MNRCVYCGRRTLGKFCEGCRDLDGAERSLDADLAALLRDHYNPTALSPILLLVTERSETSE